MTGRFIRRLDNALHRVGIHWRWLCDENDRRLLR